MQSDTTFHQQQNFLTLSRLRYSTTIHELSYYPLKKKKKRSQSISIDPILKKIRFEVEAKPWERDHRLAYMLFFYLIRRGLHLMNEKK